MLFRSTEADSASPDTRPLHHLVAGETVTVESEFPAPFYLNGRLAGNDAGQPNRLTFVVPDGPTGVALRAGSSAETLLNVAAPEAVRLSGQVSPSTGNFAVRYSGLRAELFQLNGQQTAPALDLLTPVAELPVSSLNLHNPHQAFGLFPVTGVTKPNFAVRLSGEFLAETDGQYQFALTGAEGARLTIDGRPAESVTLTAGWKRLELIVWQTSGSAELVATYIPPTGVARQPIPAALLRATFTSVKTNEDGQFTIATPAWMAAAIEGAIEGLAAGAEIRWAHKEIK